MNASVLAVHLCRHDMESRKSARGLITSVAYQIAMRLPQYQQQALTKAMDSITWQRPELVAVSPTAKDLWQSLIADPLNNPAVIAVSRPQRCASQQCSSSSSSTRWMSRL